MKITNIIHKFSQTNAYIKYKIDVSDGIDINKTSVTKESDVCHYWNFLNYSFTFQPNVYNGWHDLLMMSMNLSDIVI